MQPRPKQTRADAVRNRIRSDILSGVLRPGERLMFPDLCERYGASVGVTREALASLVADGLVRTQAHQGHVVTSLSQEDLMELTAARLAVEPLVLRQSILEGDVEWESRVVAAHHVLMRSPRETADGSGRVTDEWAGAHEALHASLFSGCTNKRLVAITAALAEEAALYRRWSAPLEADRDVAAEHRDIVAAAVARDADLAAGRLCAHISYTAQLLITHADQQVTVRETTSRA